MGEHSARSFDFILIGVIAGLVALLDYIGVVAFPVGILGVSAFYIGAAFFTSFAVWFKLRALAAMYVGLLIGALFSGTFTIFAFVLALGNVVGAAMPMLFFHFTKSDIALKKPRDYAVYVLSATILQSVISAIWVLGGLSIFGILPAEALRPAVFGWIIGDVIVSLVIGIPLLKTLSPLVQRLSYYDKKSLV